MRVLRVSHSAVVREWRGRERALIDLGVDVSLLSARSWPEGGSLVTLEPDPGERARGVATIGSHPALFLFDPRPLWRALGEEWDLIDLHEEPFALVTAEFLLLRALRRRRPPVVLYTAQNLAKRYPFPFSWFERRALRTAAGISACNPEAARITELKGFAGAARVIPLGIDPDRFHPGPAADATDPRIGGDPRSAGIVVGFAGRFVPEKGIGVLLDALGRDDRLRARIAGAGPMEAELRALATERGIADRVEFVGPVAPDEIADFYRSLDVLAVPSLTTPVVDRAVRPRRDRGDGLRRAGRRRATRARCPTVVGGAGLVVPAGDATRRLAAARRGGWPARRSSARAASSGAASCTLGGRRPPYLDLYRRCCTRQYRAGASSGDGEAGAEPTGARVEVDRRRVRPARPARRGPRPVAGCPSPSSTTRRCPRSRRCATSSACATSTPAATAGSARASTWRSRPARSPAPTCCSLNPDAVVSADDVGRCMRRSARRARPRERRARRRSTSRHARAGRVAVPVAGRHLARGAGARRACGADRSS